jgi:hypothetical protein
MTVKLKLGVANYMSFNSEHRCLKCGRELGSVVAYIPSLGEACLDCYIIAAKKDEVESAHM